MYVRIRNDTYYELLLLSRKDVFLYWQINVLLLLGYSRVLCILRFRIKWNNNEKVSCKFSARIRYYYTEKDAYNEKVWNFSFQTSWNRKRELWNWNKKKYPFFFIKNEWDPSFGGKKVLQYKTFKANETNCLKLWHCFCRVVYELVVKFSR